MFRSVYKHFLWFDPCQGYVRGYIREKSKPLISSLEYRDREQLRKITRKIKLRLESSRFKLLPQFRGWSKLSTRKYDSKYDAATQIEDCFLKPRLRYNFKNKYNRVILLYRVSIRFLQSNRATTVDTYSNSFRIRNVVVTLLNLTYYLSLFYSFIITCLYNFYLTIVSVFIQFVALRRWNSDGSRARPSSHEQENAGRAHRLHPEGSDSGKFRNARLSRFKMEPDKRLETAAISWY